MRNKIFFFMFVLFFIFSFHCAYAGELMSNEAVNYYNEGVKAQKARNFAAADVAFQKALLLNPNDPQCFKAALNNRGIIYAQGGDLETAQKIFEDLYKMDPHSRQVRMNLGLIYEKTKTRLESLEYWVKIFDLEGLKPRVFLIEEEMRVDKAK